MDKTKKTKFIQEHRQLQHLLLSAALEESGAPKIVLTTVVAVASILLVIILWASLTRIPEVASAQGVVVPKGQIPIVQHLEGGIVAQVLIEDGQQVNAGTPVILLSPTLTITELKKLQKKEVALTIDLLRLDAYIHQANLDKATIMQKVPKPQQMSEMDYQALIHDALALLKQQKIASNHERSILKAQVAQLKVDNQNLLKRKTNLISRKDNLATQVGIHQQGTVTQTSSKLQLLQAKERFTQANSDVLEIEGQMSSNESALFEAQERLTNFEARQLEQAYKERTQANKALLDIQDSLMAAQDKATRLAVHAPVNGIVKGLNLDVGSVIEPGGVLFEVVPLDEALVVEARVPPKEVGHLTLGDRVKVKVSAFNFARYGQLDGELKQLSASTFLDERGEPYYKAIIQLNKHYLGHDAKTNRILPGMTVTADIITGKKSLISYMLKPVQTTLSEAFTER